MNKLFRHVHQLAVLIGPRGATSSAEGQAADYISQTLSSFGLDVKRERFSTVSSFSYVQAIFLFGFILSWILSPQNPLIAAILATLCFIFYILDVETFWTFAYVFAKNKSENISAQLEGAQKGAPTVVICAHYDSSKAALNFHPKMVGGFRNSFFTMLGSFIGITILLWVAVIGGAGYREIIFWIMFPLVAILVFVLGTLFHREVFCQFTPGANDNASGVAVLLEVARHLVNHPPQKINVQFLATGAEEAGTFGMLEYIKRHGIAGKYFINLDNLGNGDVFVTSHEGIIRNYSASPVLLDIVRQGNFATRPYRLLTTDATPVMARGGEAISIMASDSAGLLPNWHWITDTAANVVDDNLLKGKELVLYVIDNMEKRGK